MIILPIKKKWYDMILSGEKKEEYREISNYYYSRFKNVLGFNEMNKVLHSVSEYKSNVFDVVFRNGYRSNSPHIWAEVRLLVGTGKMKWGAEKDKVYYILEILRIKPTIGGINLES